MNAAALRALYGGRPSMSLANKAAKRRAYYAAHKTNIAAKRRLAYQAKKYGMPKNTTLFTA
ncbi:hypothetical protein EBT31_08095 [bacterium]|nr:hypothetical protein [bacterium]